MPEAIPHEYQAGRLLHRIDMSLKLEPTVSAAPVKRESKAEPSLSIGDEINMGAAAGVFQKSQRQTTVSKKN